MARGSDLASGNGDATTLGGLRLVSAAAGTSGPVAGNFNGGPNNDSLTGTAGDDSIDGGAGADTMTGLGGNDTYFVDNAGDQAIEGANGGTDTVRASVSFSLAGQYTENLILLGAAAINGTGNALGNTITGNAAANILNGDTGADTMIGLGGDDIYTVDNVGDQTVEAANGGTDTVNASVSFSLAGQYTENLVLTGIKAINGTGNALANTITGNDANNELNGDTGADTMVGRGGNDAYFVDNAADQAVEAANGGTDTVYATVSFSLAGQYTENLVLTGTKSINATGNALANTLTGNSAANELNGDTGADVMRGLGGNDAYYVDNIADQVIEADGQGIDTVFASATFSLAGQFAENLVLTGIKGINATGNQLNNTLTGNSGANELNGGAGADTMRGGAGNDAYYVDNGGDIVVEELDQGADTVFSSVSFSLYGQYLEYLVLTGGAAINGTGNRLDNNLTGNDAANLLDGDFGADTMTGRGGDDIYVVDNGNDKVVEAADQGIDTVRASASHALGANVEALVLTGTAALTGVGNELANMLTGNSANNVLDGRGGDDTMAGGGGDDTYYVDSESDTVVEANGAGNDTVRSAASFSIAGGFVENIILTGFAVQAIGNGFNNSLTGNAIANYLDGGAGADTMNGGGGDDTYIVDNAGDTVAEGNNAGYDSVFSSTSFTLGKNVENLTLTGAGANNATGNALVNTLEGNDSGNTLDGGAGADQMRGRFGDDIYIVDDIGDQVYEDPNQGTDTVRASVSFQLAFALENLVLTGNAAINGTGNYFANQLTGNAAANILDGGDGADTMAGGGGNDSYYVGQAGDTVVEGSNAGTDTVYAAISYTLGANVENLRATGEDPLTLTGNALANLIVGNTGLNELDGKEGSDTLQGGGGPDYFHFTTALGANNVDAILDFSTSQDHIVLRGGAGGPFAALAAGQQLPIGAFALGASATEADDRILYDSATGILRYDSDGTGAAAAVQFATLSPRLALSATNFTVSGQANQAPVVTSGTSATVAENSSASTVVYQLVASDPDGDSLTYHLSGADAALFSIDASGAVRLLSPADYEARQSYSFIAVARDPYGLEAGRAVTLSVTDVNDPAGATPTVSETEPNDSFGQAQAIDRNALRPSDNPNLPNDDLPSIVINGTVSSPTERDYFSITLQQGEQLILDVDNSSGNLDAYLAVYRNGSEVASNDDPGPPDPGSAPHPEYGHNTDSEIRFRAPSAGTYVFAISAFDDADNPTQGSYQLNVSIGPQAPPEQILEEDVEALLSGFQWHQTALTYAFPTSPSQYPAGTTEADEPGEFLTFNATQRTATAQLLQHTATVTGLIFNEQTSNPASANLRYAMSSEPDTAYAYYPTGSEKDGTAWFNRDDYLSPQRGNYAWLSILHETGHALGLKHGHESPAVSYEHDSLEYTVMTYRAYVGDSLADGGYANEEFGFPQTLMMLDIAALQRMYGANFGYNGGDSVYRWNATTGEMSINGVGQGAPGANRVFMTIWDGGGNDTYDLTNYNAPTTIDLRPGHWTDTSSTQLANLGGGHIAEGNVANALLYQGDTRSLIENAVGGSSNDVIIANQAANRLIGNGGNDTFTWYAAGDAGTDALADWVSDFSPGSDRISLANLDLNPSSAGHEPLSFIGTSAFSNVAGQVRYEVIGGDSHVFIDTNGNGTADMEIVLDNVTTLDQSSFWL